MGSELKQSSDNLTKFARAYALTGDIKWKALFERVLDVRNGKAPIPEGHDFGYWDVIATEPHLNFTLTPGFMGETFYREYTTLECPKMRSIHLLKHYLNRTNLLS